MNGHAAMLQVGDDTGWRNQSLQILSDGGAERACFRHTRFSPSSGQFVNTGLRCSENGQPSGYFGVGDDTGWIDQRLSVQLGGQQP
jgi:hypothetical protein